jgi:hypothetical protein
MYLSNRRVVFLPSLRPPGLVACCNDSSEAFLCVIMRHSPCPALIWCFCLPTDVSRETVNFKVMRIVDMLCGCTWYLRPRSLEFQDAESVSQLDSQSSGSDRCVSSRQEVAVVVSNVLFAGF